MNRPTRSRIIELHVVGATVTEDAQLTQLAVARCPVIHTASLGQQEEGFRRYLRRWFE